MMNFDLVIHNGTIVSESGSQLADLGIKDGRIAAIGLNLTGKEVIDASGLLVIPGGVDPHVHLNMPTATTITSEDWFSGTLAAAYGGTTTILDFVEPLPGETLKEALQARKGEAAGQTWLDYGLHMTISDSEKIPEIKSLVEEGVSSFKIYTTYGDMQLNDYEIVAVLDAVKTINGIVMVHAENDAIVKHATRNLVKDEKLAAQWHPHSRPALAEVEAVQRMIYLARVSGANLYLVHLSTRGAVAAAGQALEQGQNLVAETCPQYLLLNRERYQNEDSEVAAGFVCSPPLRSPGDQQAIWHALRQKTVLSIGSDHCAFNIHTQKQAGLSDFRTIPGGIPGIELRYPLLYHFGVRSGMLSLEQWVTICSTNPAKSFGIWPQKGSLMVGADADLVLFDPAKEFSVNVENLHEKVDYTPYDNFTLIGFPVMTILKGKKLIENGVLRESVPTGTFLKCGSPIIPN
ncbi:MAG: dihydropyrimidinase [Anaerolineaceae bacterium]|nr:dihydropyrimidinase [Anaerolineaceae bacterium]